MFRGSSRIGCNTVYTMHHYMVHQREADVRSFTQRALWTSTLSRTQWTWVTLPGD